MIIAIDMLSDHNPMQYLITVHLGIFVCCLVQITKKELWRFALMDTGVQYAITLGIAEMLL